MSRPGTLWVAFALVHVVVSVLGFVLPNQPMGDVYLVYEPWSQRALAGEGIVGIDEDWVYPQLALVPLVLAHGFAWIAGYTVGWAIFVTALDAVAFAVLVGRARSRGRVTAAWFWLAAILLLGPVGLYRLDAVTVALAVMGGLWLRGRPWMAGILLAVATWIKVWPAAIIAAAVIALRRRWALVGAGLVVSVATLAAVVAAGGLDHALGFIGDQTGRGLQVEAPVSMFYLWGQMLGVPGFFVYYSTEILTFQVTGTEIDPVIASMTPILMIGVGAVAVVAALKVRRGAAVRDLLPVAALAIVTVFIVLNKVGSPQYLCWLVPPVVLGLVVARRDWARPAILVLVLSALTQLVYPVFYGEVLAAHPLGVGILTVRNALLIVLGVWMVARLVRVPVRTPSSIPA
ncbi:glycosyltransferase family 87 protein [Microbacterium sp. H37-C3]|uniref:glycosyltransferase family 87 protein n=1 Tax=Microbacterium sp. H37-C3 TaxID=3004354 RepID=UPI0022AFE16C|nr:glycosyltransferase family 87 protein [Microbacterium sp. H37-C3]MCZ4068103.1 glycosyltransferase family 87 protein [Microbacterium sp. H37-C3]